MAVVKFYSRDDDWFLLFDNIGKAKRKNLIGVCNVYLRRISNIVKQLLGIEYNIKSHVV